jgi:hypothetical protein
MKVNETQHGTIQAPSVPKSGSQTDGSETFQSIMDQVTRQGGTDQSAVRGAGPPPVMDGVQILPGAGQVEASSSAGAAGKEQLLQQIQDTLDVIDRYAVDLADPSLSTKDMQPLVDHLEGSLGDLQNMASDPEMPEALRSVVSDLTLTISTEVAKFGRGDYE